MQRSAFPGIVLLYDNRPCAAIGYTREPTGTVVLSQPVLLLDASDQVRRALCDQLLKQVKLQTTEEGFRNLQFLQDNSTEGNNIGLALVAHGFIQAAEILQWALTVELDQGNHPASPKTDSPGIWRDIELNNFNRLDFAPAESVAIHALRQALDTILKCSDDLTALPRPTATEMLMKWHQMQASVFVCQIGQSIAGVMTCATASAKACGPPSTGEINVCIEYIGVVTAFRKQHIASRLISRIPELLNLNPQQGESASLTLQAYSDATNPSATHLYQRRGFVQTHRMQLWHCDLRASRLRSGD